MEAIALKSDQLKASRCLSSIGDDSRSSSYSWTEDRPPGRALLALVIPPLMGCHSSSPLMAVLPSAPPEEAAVAEEKDEGGGSPFPPPKAAGGGGGAFITLPNIPLPPPIEEEKAHQ